MYTTRKPHIVHHCSICYNAYQGYGNNAEPVNSGLCCDSCNILVVIPARMISKRLYIEDKEGL